MTPIDPDPRATAPTAFASPTPSVAALVERLETFEALSRCPRAEREWLATHGEYRRVANGEVLVSAADESQEMIVQLSGRIVVYFGRGAGRRHAAESRAGSITGLLPFSRLKRPPSDVIATEATDFIALHRRQFPALLAACPVLVETLVHNMLDRTRRFAAADWQDEKVLSLGRLAAGLAHELNNPASAASSGARALDSSLREVALAAQAFGVEALSAGQRAVVMDVVEMCQRPVAPAPQSAIERSDREDKVAEWLERVDLNEGFAAPLAESGVTPERLDLVAQAVSGAALACAIRFIAAVSSAHQIAADVHRAARRIDDVVTAMREYSHMDRAAVREPTDVADGLARVVDVIRCGPRARGVTVTLDVDQTLPRVAAVAPDLNQVWSNLIENAMDAVGVGGRVDVRAQRDAGSVLVCVSDNGTGIPLEVQPKIFDPFFTTKPVGEGVGLGLDTVRRVVREFGGDVEFESQPGRTEFRVRLPSVG
jgi:signal transduction histidine kinase